MRKLLIFLLFARAVPSFWAHEVGAGVSTGDTGDMGDTDGGCTAAGDGECTSHSPRSLPTLAVGATYRTRFEFPLIGDYIVTMKIVRENRASLDVDGGYPIRDYFQYQLLDHDHDSEVAHTHDHDCDHDHDHSHDHPHDHPESLHFSVVLSEKLNAILHQFTVSLTEIQYDPQQDVVSAMVSILYVLTFPIRLQRIAY